MGQIRLLQKLLHVRMDAMLVEVVDTEGAGDACYHALASYFAHTRAEGRLPALLHGGGSGPTRLVLGVTTGDERALLPAIDAA